MLQKSSQKAANQSLCFIPNHERRKAEQVALVLKTNQSAGEFSQSVMKNPD